LSRGFWLGDAFASGGEHGYDHKVMGITARGAWESVRRHFRHLAIDPDTDDFTVVGIGDMSGDVFGNGMLLSHHIKLVCAFDHRHVFLDPNPDPEKSFTERKRLFERPRSSWADYDTALLSIGGGVYPRTLKSITITPEVRIALGLDDTVTACTPAELIHHALRAPVDLLYNGGIGTYVKAHTETHASVGDKANDGVRVKAETSAARNSVASSTRCTAAASTPTQSTTARASTRATTRSTSRSCSTARYARARSARSTATCCSRA
jgi:glutamate dehydrogenase